LKTVLFFLTFLSLFSWGHYFFWTRLVRDTQLGRPVRIVATITLASLAASMLLVSALQRRAHVPGFSRIGYTWMGMSVYLLLALLGASLAARVAMRATERGAQRGGPPSAEATRRRLFLARAVAAFSVLGAGVLTSLGVASVLRGPQVRRVKIRLPKLGASPRPLRIVQLTDLHVGPTIGAAYVTDVVNQTNALEPDIIVLTGDFVDGPVALLSEHIAPLALLRAREGVFFVTGNHEYYSGANEWIAHLTTLGIRVLRNERVLLDRIELAGVDDVSATEPGHGEDIARAVAGRDRSLPLVLLAHQPRSVLRACLHEVDLQISGHTHGGQFVPWNYAVKLQQPYVAGLHLHENTQLYVSCGTGYWGPPMRVGAPSEIACLDLYG
jgi:uncharacterized protein